MSQEKRLEVINTAGWRKEYPLPGGIVYIGSAPTNDIHLADEGGGVAALHAQLIPAGQGDAGYKLVNLSSAEIGLGASGEEKLAPRGVMPVTDGQSFKLGAYTLIFRESAPTGGEVVPTQPLVGQGLGGRNIGLNLTFPTPRLGPNKSLEGLITVSNLGQRSGVMFDLELEGLESDCYEIAPAPLLSSGAQKNVIVRISHRGRKPLAGDWYITIRATAPKSYPGEQAEVSATIQVLPYYRHKTTLISVDDTVSVRPPDQAAPTSSGITSDPQQQPDQIRPVTEPDESWGEPDEVGLEQAQAAAALKLKVKSTEKVEAVAITPAEAESGSPAEALWSAPVETSPPPPVETPLSAEAEDLWSAPVEPEPEIEKSAPVESTPLQPEDVTIEDSVSEVDAVETARPEIAEVVTDQVDAAPTDQMEVVHAAVERSVTVESEIELEETRSELERSPETAPESDRLVPAESAAPGVEPRPEAAKDKDDSLAAIVGQEIQDIKTEVLDDQPESAFEDEDDSLAAIVDSEIQEIKAFEAMDEASEPSLEVVSEGEVEKVNLFSDEVTAEAGKSTDEAEAAAGDRAVSEAKRPGIASQGEAIEETTETPQEVAGEQTASDDWWSEVDEVEAISPKRSRTRSEELRVLKAKAKPAGQPVKGKEISESEAEDWWSEGDG